MLVLTWISFEKTNLDAFQKLSNFYKDCAKK